MTQKAYNMHCIREASHVMPFYTVRHKKHTKMFSAISSRILHR